MGKFGNPWETLATHGKFLATCGNLGQPEATWDNLRQPGTTMSVWNDISNTIYYVVITLYIISVDI